LWLSLVISVGLALVFKTTAIMPIAIDYLPRQILALIIFACGLALRYWSVKMLGRFFTTDVAIYKQHQLIIAGPYRWVRHPAYSGVLIAFVGAGLAMGDGIALALLTVPVFIAFNYRIKREEKLLLDKLGTEYSKYQKLTKKLVPWLF
jgi:protein-S-isoprenylcysteine O-methyltransferase